MKGTNPTFDGMSGKAGMYVVYQMGGQTVLRTRPAPRTKRTDGQQQHISNVSRVAGAWRQTTDEQRQEWARLGAMLPNLDPAKPRGPQPAYNTFLMVGLCRIAQSLPILPDAPPVPVLPPYLVKPTLTGQHPNANLSLMISGVEFDSPVQVFASTQTSRGRNEKSVTGLVQIAVLPGLSASGTEIAAAYLAKWGAYFWDRQVVLRLVPLSVEGFAGPPVLVSCVVGE